MSNNRTPAAVLDAPRLTPVVVYPNTGVARRDRRRWGIPHVVNAPFVGDVARDLLGAPRRTSKGRAAGKKA